MTEVLKVLSDRLTDAGISYAFMEWTDDPVYPYFVGEYAEEEPQDEDGKIESEIILTGFARASWMELETARKTIQSIFPPVTGYVEQLPTWSCVAVYYARSFPIRTGEEDLKKIEIRLKVKKWSVENV